MVREKNTEERTLRFFRRLLKERLPVHNMRMNRATEVEVQVEKNSTAVFCYYAWFPFGKTYIRIVSAEINSTDDKTFYLFESAFQHLKNIVLKKVEDVKRETDAANDR